jgi:hypothetical protein
LVGGEDDVFGDEGVLGDVDQELGFLRRGGREGGNVCRMIATTYLVSKIAWKEEGVGAQEQRERGGRRKSDGIFFSFDISLP